MQAHILVLDHDALCLHECFGDIKLLCCVIGGGAKGSTQRVFIGVINKIDTVSRTDVGAAIAFNALCTVKDSLHIAVETPLSFSVGRVDIKAELYLNLAILERGDLINVRHLLAEVHGHQIVIAPLVHAHFLADEVHAGGGALLGRLA